MNKKEFSELHRLIAILIYECNESLLCESLSDEHRKEIIENLKALERVMKIHIFGGEIE